MTERQFKRPSRSISTASDEEVDAPVASASVQDFDAILDEIDAALEGDAEAYVKSFVQKGGQ